MPISNHLVDLNAAEEGSELIIANMRFKVKRTNENVANKISQLRSENGDIASKTRAIAKLVFKELVASWEGVSMSSLQGWITSPDFYHDEAWCKLDDMRFKVKRVSLDDVADFSKTTNDRASINKFINSCVRDWENVRMNEGDPEIQYSKSQAVELLGKPQCEIIIKHLQEFAYSKSNFALDISDKDIPYTEMNILKYMVNVDNNDLLNKITNFASNVENFRQEQISEDIETAKK